MLSSNKDNDLNVQFFIKILLVYLITTALIIATLIIFFKSFPIEDISPEALTCLPQALRIYDRHNQLITTTSGEQNRIFISLDQLATHTKMAFVSAEDSRFYTHNGIDIKRILSAFISDIKAGYYKEGASTITQQLIKNSHLTQDKKISRKIREIILALQLESRYEKDEILEMYLNYIYFGNGCYGIEVAAQQYYNKPASELTVAESASLAGIIKSPTNYSPYTNFDAFIKRRNSILELMNKYGHITDEQYSDALNEEIKLNNEVRDNSKYGYYTDQILTEASSLTGISIDDLLNGGFHIYTTMDQSISDIANSVILNDDLFPDDSSQCAVVILDSKTGAVLSLIGGREYSVRMGFNRATMAKRSPGSTIKPLLVYAPAIEEKIITAATVISDEKKVFENYAPENYNSKYYGNVTVRESLVRSLNIPAVDILNTIGVETGKKYMRKMNISFDISDTGLALALGGMTNGITPLELASCYQALANQGVQSATHFINKIHDSNNNEIYALSKETTNVYNENTAFIINSILESASKKSGSPFAGLPFQICAKTGTSSYKSLGNSDIWVSAYNSQYTTVVWIGHDTTNDQNYIPQNITGNKYPSIIAASIYNSIYETRSYPDKYSVPNGIIKADLDKDSLKNGEILLSTNLTPQKSTITEYFISGTEPKAYSKYYNIPEACTITAETNSRIPIITITPINDYTYYHLYKITNSEHELLYTFSGNEGTPLSYCDTNAVGNVKYYVVPEHMYITDIDGSRLFGKASKLITINLPPLFDNTAPPSEPSEDPTLPPSSEPLPTP